METQQLIGHRLVDKDGAAVGKIGQVFYDDQTDVAKWITVRTGLFGSRENLVPLRGAQRFYDSLQVPWPRNTIKSAPSCDSQHHISVEQEDRVYAHYGLSPEIPGRRIPEQFARPRGKHARPEPGDPRSAESRSGVEERPQQSGAPMPRSRAGQEEQAEVWPIWEPSGERPQSGEVQRDVRREGGPRPQPRH
ncbi:PRC-barrel domain-containing protein, partial [Streptomonospora algeriensis]